MASSSSSALDCSSNYSRYEVFLSFRGDDTRHSFTDHLFHALVRAGLRTFRDNDEIGRGREVKLDIESAIIESRASIVVLSENYANSTWCLDELWLILEQRRKRNHFVLPVLYHVDPSDVRNQRQSFTIEVEEGVEGSKWTEDNVKRWKAALTEVANLSGETVSGSETDFITKVVDTIDYKLDVKLLSSSAVHLTGMETRTEVINSWLKDEASNANILAIIGMGGSGKTTLAQYIYNLNKENFESSSFVEEIGKHYKQQDSLIGLQKQLLRDVLGGKNISSTFEGTQKIEKALQIKRVLIVLDDIDDQDELSKLLGTKAFPTKSKIIVTTRLLDIRAWCASISWSCRAHKVELLNDHESLELLSRHAFKSKIPMAGFDELAIQLAKYCAGNPLALKVLGSSLFVSDNDPWTREGMIKIWNSRLESLNSMKGDLECNIQGVLQKSFDSLSPSHKELFLHIACFFVGEHEDEVISVLEDDWYAKSGIRTLINRCLLTVSRIRILVMHQLIQDMGRRIAHDESKDPAKHSRVWCSDEAYHLLGKGDGSKKIEGLSLDTQKLKKGTKPLAVLETDSLVKMKNLKWLQLNNVELVGPYMDFPELIWFQWRGCNLKTIPSGLFMSSLVAIYMNCGKLEKFEPPAVLHSLKILDLRCSYKLVSVSGFSHLPKLETLSLGLCTSLTHVCKTIGDLESLQTLNLIGCTKLLKASVNKKYVSKLENLKAFFIGGGIQAQSLFFLPQSLKFLFLDFCNLEYNDDVHVVFHGKSFIYMSLNGNLFECLPDSIDLKMLRALDLGSCPNLKILPCLPSTLQELYVDWCTSLETITFQSARFSLKRFGYEGCFKLSEIRGLFKLVSIAKINEADLGDMQWIKAYQHHKVDLVGDVITKGRSWHIQMLYEYGIRSTFLQGIKDQSMMTYEYTSTSNFLSFHVPLHPKKYWIKGLNVSCLYRLSSEDKGRWDLFAKISNKTKGLKWVYNPVVYCKPKVDEEVVWLSYWPIGNILDIGDEIEINICWGAGLIVNGCGASLEYMGNGEVNNEEKFESDIREEEVIGGDLSGYEVTAGGYYLCRRDSSNMLHVLKVLFGDNLEYTDSQGWRKSRQSTPGYYPDLKLFKDSYPKKIEVGVSFNSKSEIHKIEKAVSSIVGVESVSVHKEIGRLYVIGRVDLESVATCLRKFEKMVEILNHTYIHQ